MKKNEEEGAGEARSTRTRESENEEEMDVGGGRGERTRTEGRRQGGMCVSHSIPQSAIQSVSHDAFEHPVERLSDRKLFFIIFYT